jgi:hypothetical protein
MRRLTVLVLAAAGLLVLFAPAAPAAPAASPPLLSVSPRTVHFGEQVTIKGREWPVIEFCKRTVRVRLESDQNAFLIGFAHVNDNGRFTRRFTPRKSKVGAGTWRVVARLRCESGEDGSPNFITRKRKLTILR